MERTEFKEASDCQRSRDDVAALERLLRPASIAVVGASPEHFAGWIPLANCKRLGFTGFATPVNPAYAEIHDVKAVASLADMEERPDVVLLTVGPRRVLQIIDEGLELGLHNYVVVAGGVTDSADEAKRLAQGLRERSSKHPLQIVGPNCMGFVDSFTGGAPYIGTVPAEFRAGGVAALSQSGAVIEAIVNAGGRVPLSVAVSTGSETVTPLPRYLEFAARDDKTRGVIVFLEAVDNGQELLRTSQMVVDAGKPLAVCIVGRSRVGQEGVTAHSGKLAPSTKVAVAALRQAGAVIADDLDELLTFGEIFGTGRLPRGPRTHFVVNSGGQGTFLADLCEPVGLELPKMSDRAVRTLQEQWPSFHVGNPLDPWAADDYQRIYPTAIEVAAREPGDILIVAQDQQRTCGEYEKDLSRNLARYLHETVSPEEGKVPVFLSPTSQDPDESVVEYCRVNNIPHLRGARPTLRCLGELAHALPPRRAEPMSVERDPRMRTGRKFAEHETLDLLRGYGLSTPRYETVEDVSDAVEAAGRVGYPIVLKVSARGLMHKTELGFVRTGLWTEEHIEKAASELLAASTSLDGPMKLLVVEMVRGDLEVFVGYKRDRDFGPTILFGFGGIWTEIIDEVTLCVGGADRHSAERLIVDHRIGRMVQGGRAGMLDMEGIASAICLVSAIGCAHPEIKELDVNPLIVGRDTSIAVDATVRT